MDQPTTSARSIAPHAKGTQSAPLSVEELLKPSPARGLEVRLGHIRTAWEHSASSASPSDAGRALTALSIAVGRAKPEDAKNARLLAEAQQLGAEILSKAAGGISDLSLTDLGALALSCKNLVIGDQALVRQIAIEAAKLLGNDEESLNALSRVAHLMAVRKCPEGTFFNRIERIAESGEASSSLASVATFAGVLAELDPARQNSIARLVKTAIDASEGLDDSSSRRIGRAIDVLRCAHPVVAGILGGESARREAEQSRVIPSDVLGWFNRRGFPLTEAANHRAEHEVPSLVHASFKELAAQARVFARWGVDSPSVIKRMAGIAEKLHEKKIASSDDRREETHTWRSQDVATFIGFVTPEASAFKRFFQSVLEEFPPDDVSRIGLKECAALMRAIDYSEARVPVLVAKLGDKFAEGVDHLDATVIPDILAAFAKRNHDHTAFFHVVQSRILQHGDTFSPRQLAVLSWAITKLSIGDKQFNDRFFRGVAGKVEDMRPRDMVLCAWSATAQDATSAPELCLVAAQRFERDPRLFDNLSVTQLYQAMVANGCELPSALCAAAERIFTVEKSNLPVSNQFEMSVRGVLNEMGIEFAEQHFVAGYVLDFFVEYEGRKIAIECDGSDFHRVGGDARERLRGNNLIRDKVLRQLGIETVRIIDKDWDMRTVDQRHDLIEEFLASPKSDRLTMPAAA